MSRKLLYATGATAYALVGTGVTLALIGDPDLRKPTSGEKVLYAVIGTLWPVLPVLQVALATFDMASDAIDRKRQRRTAEKRFAIAA